MDLTLSPAAQWSLVIIAVVNLLLMIGFISMVIVGIVAFKKLRAQIQPTIDRVNAVLEETKPLVASVNPLLESEVKPILENVQEMTRKASSVVSEVGRQAQEIAETSHRAVEKASRRFDNTGKLVMDGVNRPVIRAASMAAGVSRAFSVMKNYHRPNSHANRSDAGEARYANEDERGG